MYFKIIALVCLFFALFGCISPGAIVDKNTDVTEVVVPGPVVSDLNIGPVLRSFPFRVGMDDYKISAILYREADDYFEGLDRYIYYDDEEDEPQDIDFILMKVDNNIQLELLEPFISAVRDLPLSDDDKVRAVVSLVQNIPYDSDGADSEVGISKFPYEVLYKQSGVCGEKSKLVVLILRELGYGTAIFDYDFEEHQAVGVACAPEFDYFDSGYCFIETTGIVPITYAGGMDSIVGVVPQVVPVSAGRVFDARVDAGISSFYSDVVAEVDELELEIDSLPKGSLRYNSAVRRFNVLVDVYNSFIDGNFFYYYLQLS